MQILLERKGGRVSALQGALANHISAGGRDGYASNYLNNFNIFAAASNAISIDTGLIQIQGFRVQNDGIHTQTIATLPSQPIQYHLIAILDIRLAEENSTCVFGLQPIQTLRKDNIFQRGEGVYEVELARFTVATNGISNIARTIQPLTGGTPGGTTPTIEGTGAVFVENDVIKVRDDVYVYRGNHGIGINYSVNDITFSSNRLWRSKVSHLSYGLPGFDTPPNHPDLWEEFYDWNSLIEWIRSGTGGGEETPTEEKIVGEFAYTGAVQEITLPAGKYRLECWGARGFNRIASPAGKGAPGGYSKGTLTLTEPTKLFIRAGGIGASQIGGYNGGGNAGGGGNGHGGGGATDIRIATDTLNHRVIVAGAGSGATRSIGSYGVGGGEKGGRGQQQEGEGYEDVGEGGTQTEGGAAGVTLVGTPATPGTFGNGGDGARYYTPYTLEGSGGGGGFWGGGGGGFSGSVWNTPGGGGSGFVYVKAHNLIYLDTKYFLTDAQTIAGNQKFLSPTGVEETGHADSGYVRITQLDVPTDGGTAGRGISSTEITYKAHTSGTTPPTGVWTDYIPSVAQGSYLWTRIVFTYTSGEPATTTFYTVARQGADGAPGSTGDIDESEIDHSKLKNLGYGESGHFGFASETAFDSHANDYQMHIQDVERRDWNNSTTLPEFDDTAHTLTFRTHAGESETINLDPASLGAATAQQGDNADAALAAIGDIATILATLFEGV